LVSVGLAPNDVLIDLKFDTGDYYSGQYQPTRPGKMVKYHVQYVFIYTSLFTMSGSKYNIKKEKHTQTIYKMSNQTSHTP